MNKATHHYQSFTNTEEPIASVPIFIIRAASVVGIIHISLLWIPLQ